MGKIQKTALIDSLLTTLYIVGISLFFTVMSKFKLGNDNNFLAPIVFLSLFVFSATLTGYLMLGKPALMYIDGKKKEAVSLLGYTLGFFFLFTLIGVLILLAIPK